MTIEIHAWIEPFDAPEVGADRRLVAEADLPPGMWQGPHQFFTMTERKRKKKVTWGDYGYIWIRPGRSDEFTAKEMRFLEWLMLRMGPTARFWEHMALFDGPHFMLIAYHSDHREAYLTQLRQAFAERQGRLIISGAPNLVSFFGESSR
ncbi:MAG TPA: hypothetical protein VFZ48_03610 [Candidatus Saccharimonadales bacterium]